MSALEAFGGPFATADQPKLLKRGSNGMTKGFAQAEMRIQVGLLIQNLELCPLWSCSAIAMA